MIELPDQPSSGARQVKGQNASVPQQFCSSGRKSLRRLSISPCFRDDETTDQTFGTNRLPSSGVSVEEIGAEASPNECVLMLRDLQIGPVKGSAAQ